MSDDTVTAQREKILYALELSALPVTLNQLETLASCRSLQAAVDSLVSDGLVVAITHSAMSTSGQTADEKRYQLGDCT